MDGPQTRQEKKSKGKFKNSKYLYNQKSIRIKENLKEKKLKK